MKRSSFLKSLLGIVVAPMAIAKVMKTETVINPITQIPEKYKGEYGAKEFKRIWDEAGQYTDTSKYGIIYPSDREPYLCTSFRPAHKKSMALTIVQENLIK